ncbi:iron ABC transporter permease [Actinosynnema pretiosum subsp. pretiosum]|uniref:Transport system permease protein n=2 Tax=Actinosynnema TaxID=40566 RepID=C6WEI6_ACTMD|nr:iron ABC transporter permease [Actinosynnema mirum]ACU37786.1 transport system permease protein [Actinosynnema mirum DSM 43827]AXX31270.1 ABC transporter (iron.B12.siderophore.hemin), permease component [Actinosynnema pretiosum subsp. pretiosum]QUF04667.1 iron ABC transporter permease [Actinosynnema pretiosum subsp. pretiosum]
MTTSAPETTRAPEAAPRRARLAVVLLGLGGALALSVLLATSLGPVRVPLRETAQVVLHHLSADLFRPADPVNDHIVWQFRLPRALLGAVVGAGLASVGVVLQAVVRNPLADPYLLGVSSGASLGAVLVLVVGSSAVAGLGLSSAAFAGALVATLLVYLLAQRAGRVTPFRLILAGVSLAYLFQALYGLLLLHASPYDVQGVLVWLFGSLGSTEWGDVGVPAACVVAGVLYLLTQARSLNSLLAGEETAVSLGLDVARFRVRMLVVTSLVVGVVVAVSGAVAFVGLIVPHLCRMVVGSEHRALLPVAALTGAVFLVLMDLAARTVLAPSDLPLSIVTSVFGVPFFIWLLRQREAGREARFG